MYLWKTMCLTRILMTFYIFKSYLALRMAPSLISIIMYRLNMMRRVCLEAWNTRFTNKRRFKVKRIFLAVSQVLRLHWERITEADSRSEGNYLKRECRLYSRCFLTFFCVWAENIKQFTNCDASEPDLW